MLAADGPLANAAAGILLTRPSAVDVPRLISGFNSQSPEGRRLYCYILSQIPQASEALQTFFIQALNDRSDSVRWQFLSAIKNAGWDSPRVREALFRELDDPNEIIAAAAVYSLAKLNANNAAPLFYTRLKACLLATNDPAEELEKQFSAIGSDPNFFRDLREELHVGVSRRVIDEDRHRTAMRRLPKLLDLSDQSYNLADALTAALGQFGYAPLGAELFEFDGTNGTAPADRDLSELTTERAAAKLLAAAKNKATDSYVRERALVVLCDIYATNSVREIIPLLDDTTPINYARNTPGMPWRVCDRAAETIAMLEGWNDWGADFYTLYERREETMSRVRSWAKRLE
jgi:hypothetical protein